MFKPDISVLRNPALTNQAQNLMYIKSNHPIHLGLLQPSCSKTFSPDQYMNSKSYSPALKLETLSEEQIQKIHLASLEILEDIGMRILHKEARELLCDHGASEAGGHIVRIPAGLVQKALSSAPEMVILYDRAGKPAMRLGGTECLFRHWLGHSADSRSENESGAQFL